MTEADVKVTDGTKRHEEDLKLLQALTAEIDIQLQLSDAVRFARHLGELNLGDTPRPLLIGFNNIADKNVLLDNVKKFKDKVVDPDNVQSII